MKKPLLLLFCMMTICACEAVSADSLLVQPQRSSTTIPLSEAMASLDQMLEEMSISTKTSNNKSYSVSSVNPIGRSSFIQTKSSTISPNIPDTLMYLVNFDDNNGFAVLAGDSRLGERVYCITENGSIGADDFAKALKYLEGQALMTKSCEETDDSFVDIGTTFVPALLLSSMMADIEYGPEANDGTKAVEDIVQTYNQPLLSTKWKQGAPFNSLTPVDSDSGMHCPVGCTPLACAQIMQFCQKPSNPVFDGVNCSWATMGTVCTASDRFGYTATEEAKDQVAHFLKHLGSKDYCNVSYAIDGSGASSSTVVKTLKSYNYKNVTMYTGFGLTNQGRASAMLGAGLPVYISGFDFHNGGGHAWVIDGEWNGHFHCNWGWNGLWDGYFTKHNYFDFQYRRGYDSIDPGTTNSSMIGRSYDWNFRVITYSL